MKYVTLENEEQETLGIDGNLIEVIHIPTNQLMRVGVDAYMKLDELYPSQFSILYLPENWKVINYDRSEIWMKEFGGHEIFYSDFNPFWGSKHSYISSRKPKDKNDFFINMLEITKTSFEYHLYNHWLEKVKEDNHRLLDALKNASYKRAKKDAQKTEEMK